jgi:hypothetical protein
VLRCARTLQWHTRVRRTPLPARSAHQHCRVFAQLPTGCNALVRRQRQAANVIINKLSSSYHIHPVLCCVVMCCVVQEHLNQTLGQAELHQWHTLSSPALSGICPAAHWQQCACQEPGPGSRCHHREPCSKRSATQITRHTQYVCCSAAAAASRDETRLQAQDLDALQHVLFVGVVRVPCGMRCKRCKCVRCSE